MNTQTSFARRTHLQAVRLLYAMVAALPAVLALSSSASAQTLNWTSFGNSTLGGSGTWDTTSSNWWNGSVASTWGNSTTSNATFGGTAGVVSLGQSLAVNNITFNTSGYSLNGANTLSFVGTAPTITVGSGLTATIGSNTATTLAGTLGLIKAGSGTLTLNGTAANTLTGGLSVTGGTLALNLSNFSGNTTFDNLLSSSNSLSLSGGIVSVAGKSLASSTSSQTFNNTTVNSGVSSIVLTNGSNATSVTANLGQVTMNTGSTLLLTAPSASTRYFVTNGGSITVPASGNATFMRASIMYGSGASTRWAMVGTGGNITTSIGSTIFTTDQAGPGSTQLLSNINQNSVSITGNMTSFGTLLNTTNGNQTVTINTDRTWTQNGIIGIASNTATIAAAGTGKLVIGSERDFVINMAAAGNLIVGAPVVNNGAGASNFTVSSTGSGLVTLNGANTYTGQTTLNSGNFTIGSTGTINTSSGILINGGTFRYNNTTAALVPTVTLRAGTLTGTGAVSFGDVVVANNPGAILTNNNGAAGAALTVGNLSFSGAAGLNLFLNSTSAAIVAAGVSTNSAGTVTITPVFNTGLWTTGSTYNLLTYTGGNISGAGFGQFSLGTVAGLNSRQSTSLGNSGSAITLTVNGDNPTWSGVSNGDWNTTQTGNWKLVAGGTDTSFISGDEVHFTDAATGTTSVNITQNVSTSAILFNNTVKDYTIGSAGGFGITSAISLTKNGTATVTLSSNNSYSGSTAINDGVLRVQGGNGIGDSSVVTTANLATARLDVQSSETIGGLAGGGSAGGNVSIATGQILTLSGSTPQTFAGTINGNGGLALSGTANQTLSGGFGYTGATALNGTSTRLSINRADTVAFNSALSGNGTFALAGSGTLILGNSNSFNGTVSLANTAGTTLDLNGLNQTFGSISGGGTNGGTIALGNSSLSVKSGTGTYSGNLTGSGSLLLTGGSLNLGKASSNYTGNVTVSSGAVLSSQANISHVLGTNASGTQVVTVESGATFSLGNNNNAASQLQNYVINGTGAGGQQAAFVSTGMGFGSAQIRGLVVASDSSLLVNSHNSGDLRGLVAQGPLAGSGNLTITAGANSGFLSLSAASASVAGYSAFTGNVNVRSTSSNASLSAGLISNNSTALGSTANIDLDSNTYFTVGASQTIGGLSSNVSAVIAPRVNLGANTLTIGSSNNLSGIFSGVISGTGGITKSGSGNLSLTSTNTYTGATNVSNGILYLANATDTIANTSNVTVSGGSLNLGSNSDTVGTVTITSGSIDGSGTLTGTSYALQGGTVNAVLGTGNITVATGNTTLGSAGRLNSASGLTVSSGQLTLGGNESVNSYIQTGGTLAGVGTLTSAAAYDVRAGNISAQLGGSVGLNKSTTGNLSLSGSNSYTGATAITGGILSIANKDALNGTSGITVGTGTGSLTSLRIDVPNATSTSIGAGKSVTIRGAGVGNAGALLGADSTSVTWAGDVVIGDTTAARVGGGVNGALTIDGVISEATPGSNLLFSRAAGSTTILNKVNTYTGDTQFFSGGSNVTLKMGIANAINSASRVSNSFTTTGTAYFDLNGYNQNVRALSDTVTGDVVVTNSSTTSDAELKLSTNSTESFNGWIQDGASKKISLVVTGTGSQTLSGNNSYSGLTTVSGGVLNIASTGSLKSGNDLTVGASGNATFANAGQTLGAVSNANVLNFTAATGNVTLSSLSGVGTTTFISNGTSTISGGISTGTVNANNGLLAASVSGGTVSAGSLNATSVSGGTTTVSGVATIGTMSAGTANLNGATSSIATLNGGTVNLGTTALTVNDGSSSGAITGTNGSLIKAGSGTLTLSGTNSYSGGTTVNGGSLFINSSTGAGTGGITVNSGVLKVNAVIGNAITLSGGTLSGNATLAVDLGLNSTASVISPGNSPGISAFTTTQNWTAYTYDWEINNFTGTTAGTDFDNIAITTGGLNLTGGTSYVLNVLSLMGDNTSGIVPNFGENSISWSIISTQSGITAFDAGKWTINSTAFAALNGSTGTFSLVLTNADKDLSLVYTPVPEPSAYAAMAGFGALGLAMYRRRRASQKNAA